MPISFKVMIPRSAEGGKIKLGQVGVKTKSGKGKEYSKPVKLESKEGPYFIITKTIRGSAEDTNFLRDAAIMKQLEEYAECDSDGIKRLRQIPIMLDSDAIEEIAPHRLALYRGTNLFCTGTGDGKGAATRWEGGVPGPVDCPCDFLRARQGEKCKPNLILWCTIVAGAETRLGVRHAFRTTGWNSIKSILAGLETIQAQVGTICGIKLWLCVNWDLKKDGTGTTRRVPVVHVECRTNDLMGLRQQAIASARTRLEVIQLQNPAVLALPAPAANETKPTQAAVAAEWYPPGMDPEPQEDDEDEDEEIYDPDTGEVYEDGTKSEPEPQSKRGTDPAMPITDPLYTTAKPNEQWPSDHPARKRVAAMIKRLAFLRDVPDPKSQEAMISVLSEVTLRVLDKDVPFGALTIMQASLVDASMLEEIRRREAEDAEDAKAADVKQEDLWIPD